MHKFITDFFNTNHQALELLFIAYRRHKSRDAVYARQLFDKFKAGMQEHIGWEENLLLPALENANRKSFPTDKARAEHQQVMQQINWIEGLLDKGVDTSQDDMSLEYMLNDHFENDEFNLYPVCDRVLSDDDTARILMAIY
jgi:hemerythrin-like domain-containing protein